MHLLSHIYQQNIAQIRLFNKDARQLEQTSAQKAITQKQAIAFKYWNCFVTLYTRALVCVGEYVLLHQSFSNKENLICPCLSVWEFPVLKQPLHF